MDAVRIVDGIVYSGHYVFVRDRGTLSNSDFLSALKLSGYSLRNDLDPRDRFAYVSRLNEWIAFADDWYYTLYNSGHAQRCVERLAENFEVIRTAVGDADNSYEFYHFKNGQRVRAFSLDDWGLKPKGVVLDEGERFKCERNFKERDPWKYVNAVAREAGIEINRMELDLITYAKPYQKQNRVGTGIEPAPPTPPAIRDRSTAVPRC